MSRLILPGLAAALLATAAAAQSKFNEKVSVGEKAPGFEDLEGTDGKRHRLSDYKDAEVLVLAFTCNQCPMAQAYEERFKRFVKTYRKRKVAFVAINPCGGTETMEKMKERAEEHEFNFHYLADRDQKVARSYGAAVTPQLFVLDKQRRIAYMGAFDDKMDPSKVKHRYLEEAVDALLDGRQPEVAETLQFGCAIEYN
jgi:peroxiredoxin